MLYSVRMKVDVDDHWAQNVTPEEIAETFKGRMKMGMGFRVNKVLRVKVRRGE